MPLYEYECDSCGHRFEVIQKFSDEPLTTCPKCHGAVRKLLSSPAIQFKGSGWYITDYARKGGSGGAAKGDTSTDKGATSGESSVKKDAPAATDSATKSSTPSTKA